MFHLPILLETGKIMIKFLKKIFTKQSSHPFQNKFKVPQELKTRIVHIAQCLVEEVVLKSPPFTPNPFESPAEDFYQRVHETLCYEFKGFSLGNNPSAEKNVIMFLLLTKDSEKLLRTIECLFQFAYSEIFAYRKIQPFPNEHCIDSFNEIVTMLNQNFNENGVGYQYESGQMIGVDSQFTHQEIIKPVLTILADPMYKGANAEFRCAYDHYQAGRYKESINECLKAFESCIKSICEKRKWNYNQTDAAKKLIDILFNEGLFEKYMVSQFGGVRSVLESGIPTMRNKQSGHGQGPKVISIPKHMARYALNLTGSNITLLADLERDTR